MLHSIKEVCELTDRSRSSIYRMFGRGDLAYMVGKDGKRRGETSELWRGFDEINFQDPSSLSEQSPAVAQQPPSPPVPPPTAREPSMTARELNDLRGMIHDMKSELDDIREDNRRLLRLLEHQTVQPTQQPPVPPVAEPVTKADPISVENELSGGGETAGDEETIPVTEVAEQGWKAYRKQRAVQEKQRRQQRSSQNVSRSSEESHLMGELPVWLKNFFFGEWQKRT